MKLVLAAMLVGALWAPADMAPQDQIQFMTVVGKDAPEQTREEAMPCPPFRAPTTSR